MFYIKFPQKFYMAISRKENSMENNNMSKQCKFNCNLGLCNGKSCKTCHFNETPKQEIAQNINYGAVKRYNQSKTGKVYRTEVMRF